MKKTLITGATFFLPILAFAQSGQSPQLTGVKTLAQSIGQIIDLLIPIVFALAMLYFFWGLAQYILNSGDSAAQEDGKNRMIWGIVALFVMSAVWGLVRFLGGALDIGVGQEPDFTPGQLVPGNSSI